jgi:hypothetical protein
MKPCHKPHTTRVLMAPSAWDGDRHGTCVGLPVSDSEGVMYSYWQPTWRQRLQILVGRPVRLCVVGSQHPAVALDTED